MNDREKWSWAMGVAEEIIGPTYNEATEYNTKKSIARIILETLPELESSRTAELEDALVELIEWQNGPPLVTYTDEWNAAMRKACLVLGWGEWEDQE